MKDGCENQNISSDQLDIFSANSTTPVSITMDNETASFQLLSQIEDCGSLFCSFLKTSGLISKILAASLVFIKVNLTSAELPESGKISNPLIIESLIKALNKVGVPSSIITVADSSVIGVKTLHAANVSGIQKVCDENGIRFTDLYDGPFKECSVQSPKKNVSIPVHELALSDDVFSINCAKIKTTYGSPVGLCIKNMKGLIPDETKLDFHLKGVQESLVDLRHVITCDLNILEGFPSSQLGVPVNCNLIGISTNDILLDAIISEIIGVSVQDVPHLRMLVEEKGWNIPDLIKSPQFALLIDKLPKLEYSVHGINDIAAMYGLKIIDGKPCSSCLESFYKAISKTYKHDMIPLAHTFVLGSYHVETDWDLFINFHFVFVGECALKTYRVRELLETAEKQAKCGSHYPSDISAAIPGCPPTIDSMVSCFEKINSQPLCSRAHSVGYLSNAKKSLHLAQEASVVSESITVSAIAASLVQDKIRYLIDVLPQDINSFENFGIVRAIQCELIAAAMFYDINWEVLRCRIKEKEMEIPGYWCFDNLRCISDEEVASIFNCSIKDPCRIRDRANMLRELAQLGDYSTKSFYDILQKSGGHLDGYGGLLTILRKLSAFDDPSGIKAQVLVHSLMKFKLWTFEDNGMIRPYIDNHVTRLYVRRRNILLKTDAGVCLLEKELNSSVADTNAVGILIADSMRHIAALSQHSLVEVNYAEWWIGKFICDRESPDCDLARADNAWLKSKYAACPYREICQRT